MNQERYYFVLFARIVLALGFLSAVADRFGLWTPLLGANGVFWGSMQSFAAYTGTLAPWVPQAVLPAFAWLVTLFEIVFGVGLLAGVCLRWMALGAGILVLLFGISMFFFAGVKAPFDYSVFPTAACALMVFAQTKKN